MSDENRILDADAVELLLAVGVTHTIDVLDARLVRLGDSHEALRAALVTATAERDALRLACGQWADIAERERDRAKAVEAERDLLVREANEQNAADYQVRLELLSLNELRALPERVGALEAALRAITGAIGPTAMYGAIDAARALLVGEPE